MYVPPTAYCTSIADRSSFSAKCSHHVTRSSCPPSSSSPSPCGACVIGLLTHSFRFSLTRMIGTATCDMSHPTEVCAYAAEKWREATGEECALRGTYMFFGHTQKTKKNQKINSFPNPDGPWVVDGRAPHGHAHPTPSPRQITSTPCAPQRCPLVKCTLFSCPLAALGAALLSPHSCHSHLLQPRSFDTCTNVES
jgi:hypothetical protein